MRLSHIHIDNDKRQIQEATLVVETLLTQIQTWLATNKQLLANDPELKELLASAKDMETSLLDSGGESDAWWADFLNAYEIPQQYHAAVANKVKATISGRIDRSVESPTKHQSSRTNNRNWNRRLHEGVDHLQSKLNLLVEAGWGERIANAADWINPEKRSKLVALSNVKANNARIAIMAINYMEKEIGAIRDAIERKDPALARKGKGGKPREPGKTKLDSKKDVQAKLAAARVNKYVSTNDMEHAAELLNKLLEAGYAPRFDGANKIVGLTRGNFDTLRLVATDDGVWLVDRQDGSKLRHVIKTKTPGDEEGKEADKAGNPREIAELSNKLLRNDNYKAAAVELNKLLKMGLMLFFNTETRQITKLRQHPESKNGWEFHGDNDGLGMFKDGKLVQEIFGINKVKPSAA